MITHVVLLKFKSGVSDADIKALETRLDGLPNKIREIQMYEFGRNLVRSERASDFALVSLFANIPALERYQNHPEHLPVLEMIKGLCESVVTADFSASDARSTEAGAPEWERDPFERLKH
jgi:hypothetical protein